MNVSTKLENNEVVVEEKVYYDKNDMHGEMMRYRNNSLSYKLGMLAIVFSVLAAFISLNSIKWDVDVVIKILGNIVILLFGFLSIEKVKAYSKSYALVLIFFSIVCIARIFWMPLRLIIDYTAYLADVTAVGRLGPTIVGKAIDNAYLPQSGYTRAIIAIVFLTLSSISFLGSGVVGYIKAKRYEKYMSTQDISKGV